MGMDISGGMIVGALGSDLTVPEEYDGALYEWLEDLGFDRMSQWYDCGPDNCYYGITMPDVEVGYMDPWVRHVKKAAIKFKELTGVDAQLIGTQDIT